MTYKLLSVKLLAVMTLLNIVCMAQPKAIVDIAGQASTANLKKNLYYLASDKLQGRLMGTHGDTLAAKFIAAHFADSKLITPYSGGKSYYQTITETRVDDHTTLTFNGRTIPELEGWQLYPNLPFRFTDIPVVLTSFTSIDEWNKNLPMMNVAGKALIITYKAFADTKRIDSLEGALKVKGAKLVIWSGPRTERVIAAKKASKFLPRYQTAGVNSGASPLPEISLVTKLLQELLKADNITANADFTWTMPPGKTWIELKTRISVERARTLTKVNAPNVIGMIKGNDNEASAIIISAHHDHDGMDGTILYPGAIDNASGTVAIMEVAALFNKAAKAGYKPKRSIIFASYTGEERGLLGSFYFAEHPLVPISKTHAVINIDMLGRPDTIHLKNKALDSLNYAYILVKDTVNHGLRKALYDANNAVNLTLDTHYEQPQYALRRIMGSDQYPFYAKGVPFVRIDCGFVKEYHKPQDTPDKVNYQLLTKQTQLAFLTLWNMAND